MAAQWNLALAVDPLHYFTHWHFGNGHTDQTYADYAHPTDSLVRERMNRPAGESAAAEPTPTPTPKAAPKKRKKATS